MNKKVIEIIMETVNQISTKFQDEPLDGDEVDLVAQRLRVELDFNQGNIKKVEYDQEYSVKAWQNWFREKL